MAITNRWAHQPLVMIVAEAEYGTAVTTPTNKYAALSCTWKHAVERVHIPMHTQTLEPKIATELEGRKKYNLTLSGPLNSDMEWLLKAFFMDSSSPYVIPVVGTTPTSYTIYRAFPASGADAGDGMQAEGCVLQRLVFTKNGDYVEFTADFVCEAIDEEVDFSSLTLTTITDTSLPTHNPFLFHNVTCALLTETTTLNNFTITLEKELLPDDHLFQNSQEIINPYAIGMKATVEAEYFYGVAEDDDAYDAIYTDTPDTNVISFVNASKTWAFTMKGQYTDWTPPDAEKGICVGKFVMECMGDSDDTAISVAVT